MDITNKHFPLVKKYYNHLERDIILATKCKECGFTVFPPMPTCTKCGSVDMEWSHLPEEVIVENFTIVKPRFVKPEFKKFIPYYVALGHLENGSEFALMLIGVKDEEHCQKLYDMLPFKAKPIIVDPENANYRAVALQAPEVESDTSVLP